VCYYGGGMTEAGDETPQCPVMAHFGERDASIPVDGVRRFAQAHPQVDVLLYDADHAFNNDERKNYNAAASALARQRSLDFLRRYIG